MKLAPHASSLLVMVAAVAWTGLWAGCGGEVSLGTKDNEDSGFSGFGGAVGSGGAGTGGSNADAAFGGGGAIGGAGGAPDAPMGTGGLLATGGTVGTGGATSVGGNTGNRCGTIAGITCTAGQFCDMAACGLISDGVGTCVPNVGISCTADVNPVCGCDGKTYSNDCIRILAGVYKSSNGACGGATGGAPGSGGKTGSGGAPGSGGKTGSGGATGAGGGTGTICGGYAGVPCPAGQFCDLASQCGAINDAAGVCRAMGAGIGCITAEIPVCGCDGKTYSNDCERMRLGMLKSHDGGCSVDGGVDGGTTGSTCPYQCRTDSSGVTGWYSGNTLVCAADCTACVASCSLVGTRSEGCYASCPPGSTALGGCNSASSSLIAYKTCGGSYPTAYLAWEVPGGVAGTGPAVVVNASTGWAGTWNSVAGFTGFPTPQTPSNPTVNYSLTRTQTDDLFSRLAAVNVSVLPHPMSIGFREMYPRLYFRLCEDCAATTLSYQSAKQLAPEMEPVWSWFDALLGATANTNPHTWCDFSSYNPFDPWVPPAGR